MPERERLDGEIMNIDSDHCSGLRLCSSVRPDESRASIPQ